MASVRPPLFGPPPAVVGHRGAPAMAPENTPASFAAAARAGATWVELDARLDATGGVAVHHDPELPDGRAIIDLSTAECRAAGLWGLADVLEGLPPALGVDLEIKNFPGEPDHDESMRIVEACLGVLERTASRPLLISSFNPSVLVAVAEEGAPAPLGLLTMGVALAGAVDAAVELGCAAVCPHHATAGLDDPGIRAAQDAGLAVMAWTVDDPDRAVALSRAGVDALCTNDPVAVGRALRRLPPG